MPPGPPGLVVVLDRVRVRIEDSAGPEVGQVGQPDTRQGREEIGLDGTDAVVRAGAESAARCHEGHRTSGPTAPDPPRQRTRLAGRHDLARYGRAS